MDETKMILTKAPRLPAAPASIDVTRAIRAVLMPARTEARKNFQTSAITALTGRLIGFPAYQKPGNSNRKNDAVQAKAMPTGPQRNINRKRLAVQPNSIKPHINQRSGLPMER